MQLPVPFPLIDLAMCLIAVLVIVALAFLTPLPEALRRIPGTRLRRGARPD